MPPQAVGREARRDGRGIPGVGGDVIAVQGCRAAGGIVEQHDHTFAIGVLTHAAVYGIGNLRGRFAGAGGPGVGVRVEDTNTARCSITADQVAHALVVHVHVVHRGKRGGGAILPRAVWHCAG